MASAIPSPTVGEVIIHHPDGLHIRVNDGGAHEAEARLLEVLAQRIAHRGTCGDLSAVRPLVHQRYMVHMTPQESIEGTLALFHDA